MRTHCIAQGTLFSALWSPKWEGNPKGADICIPGLSSGKETACQCRKYKRHKFDPWVGRSPGEGNDNPPQYSCLEKSMNRGAWWATVHRVAKSQT